MKNFILQHDALFAREPGLYAELGLFHAPATSMLRPRTILFTDTQFEQNLPERTVADQLKRLCTLKGRLNKLAQQKEISPADFGDAELFDTGTNRCVNYLRQPIDTCTVEDFHWDVRTSFGIGSVGWTKICTAIDIFEATNGFKDIPVAARKSPSVVLFEALTGLKERDREVFISRYVKQPPVAVKVLAAKLGISSGNVSQSSRKVFEKIQGAVGAEELTELLRYPDAIQQGLAKTHP